MMGIRRMKLCVRFGTNSRGPFSKPHRRRWKLRVELLPLDSTRVTLEKEMEEPRILGAKLDDPVTQVNAALITGLVLGSPEFQKR